MSYQVLARKWRPKSFATLVGQEHVVLALSHALDQQRLHHAYLFTGTRGVGKTTVARIMAKALNCETGITSTPCGVCSACTEIDGGRFIDYIEMDAASNRGIDDMTQLLERATYAPTRGRYKVYVIDEVHQLTGPAFNAMLKTLEEPPEHIKFILATTDPQKIPVTVLSRCLQFNLKQMPMTHIIEHLARVLEAEGIVFEQSALRHLAKGAAGSMRDALSLLDQAIAHGAGKVEEDGVRAMLGTVGDEHLFAMMDGLLACDVHAMLDVAKLMDARSLSFDSGLQELATLFHRIALMQFAPEALLDESERARLAPYASGFDPEFLQLAYQIAIHGRDELSLAPDEYAGFVMTLLRLHAFRPERAGATGGKVVSAPAAVRRPSTAATSSTVAVPSTVAKPSVAPVSPAVSADTSPVAASAAQPTASLAAATVVQDAVAVPLLLKSADDWHGIVGKLLGMTRQLAQHCELVEHGENLIRLRLDPAHKHLQMQQEKLQAALREIWSSGSLRLEVVVLEPAGETPALRRQNAERDRQEKAISSIEQDPVVRDMVDLFDASIDVSTIKPL